MKSALFSLQNLFFNKPEAFIKVIKKEVLQ